MSEGRDCLKCGQHIAYCECKEGVTLHRSSVTGQFVTEAEAKENPAETTTETVKVHSPYIKKLIILGEVYEKSGGAPDELGHLVTWAVNGMSAE